MFWTKVTCFLATGILLAVQAVAAPTAHLAGAPGSNGTFNWTLSFAPDASFFEDNPDDELGSGGSLATEFLLEIAPGNGGFTNPEPTTNFEEQIGGVNIINWGDDPYTGGISEGITSHAGVMSQLGQAGMFDAIFVPLGSTFFTSGGAKAALTFTTSVDTVTFGGLIAQGNNNELNTDDVYTIAPVTVTVIVEQSFADIVMDGVVDDLDLAAFFGQWGDNPGSFADFNSDNRVDDLDLAAFFGQWDPAGAVASSTSVPEPSSIVMAGLSLTGLGLASRRK